MSLAGLLQEAAARAGLEVSSTLADACATHHRLLVHWNKTHNLTRVTSPEEAAHRHYLDSLWPALVEPGLDRVVDIGSGAGFPGLMVALAWPQAEMTLVEPAQKRASFLRLAIAELGLGARVRVASPPAAPGPLVLSRATFSPGERAPLGEAVAPGGSLWLWSVAAEEPGWAAAAREIGLEAIAPLSRVIEGERRVILRARR